MKRRRFLQKYRFSARLVDRMTPGGFRHGNVLKYKANSNLFSHLQIFGNLYSCSCLHWKIKVLVGKADVGPDKLTCVIF